MSLASRSAKFITVSALYDMIGQYLGRVPEKPSEPQLQQLEDETVDFWHRLTSSLREWQEVEAGNLRPAEARLEYINAHSVFFFAIGAAGRELKIRDELDLLGRLDSIDWRRTNKEWQGICMLGPDIVTRRQTRAALVQQILYRLGVEPAPSRHVLHD